MSEASSLIIEYWSIVDGLYGAYLDSSDGFLRVAQDAGLERDQLKVEWERKSKQLGLPIGQAYRSFGRKLDRSSTKGQHLHHVSYEEYVARNQKGGENWIFAGNATIISIYHYWEFYRKKIASAMDVPETSIKIPVFGDLRNLRHSIVHNRGTALPEIARAEMLNWFQPEDRIVITKSMIESMVDEVRDALGKLQTNPDLFVERGGSAESA